MSHKKITPCQTSDVAKNAKVKAPRFSRPMMWRYCVTEIERLSTGAKCDKHCVGQIDALRKVIANFQLFK
jgi:hypothetical protein